MKKGIAADARIALNPSPFTPDLLDLPLNKLSYVFLNRNEASEFTGKNPMDVEALIPSLRRIFPNAEVVLTMGMKELVLTGLSHALIAFSLYSLEGLIDLQFLDLSCHRNNKEQ